MIWSLLGDVVEIAQFLQAGHADVGKIPESPGLSPSAGHTEEMLGHFGVAVAGGGIPHIGVGSPNLDSAWALTMAMWPFSAVGV